MPRSPSRQNVKRGLHRGRGNEFRDPKGPQGSSSSGSTFSFYANGAPSLRARPNHKGLTRPKCCNQHPPAAGGRGTCSRRASSVAVPNRPTTSSSLAPQMLIVPHRRARSYGEPAELPRVVHLHMALSACLAALSLDLDPSRLERLMSFENEVALQMPGPIDGRHPVYDPD
jgi:hypothetical protein